METIVLEHFRRAKGTAEYILAEITFVVELTQLIFTKRESAVTLFEHLTGTLVRAKPLIYQLINDLNHIRSRLSISYSKESGKTEKDIKEIIAELLFFGEFCYTYTEEKKGSYHVSLFDPFEKEYSNIHKRNALLNHLARLQQLLERQLIQGKLEEPYLAEIQSIESLADEERRSA